MQAEQEHQKRGAWGRGTVRKHHGGYQVRVRAGTDPVTGERLTLQGTALTLREAEMLRTKLLADADNYRAARTRASLGICWPGGCRSMMWMRRRARPMHR